MKKRSSKLTVFSRFFIAFLSSVFLFAFLILLTLRLTLFSETYITKQAEKADYYSELAKEVNRQVENSSLGSNIPEGVLANIVSEKIIKKDVDAYFEAMYDPGVQFELSNEEEIATLTTEAVKEYMNENAIEITPESEQAVESISKNATTIYKEYVELPFLISFGRKVLNYKSKLILFMMVCGVLWVLLSVALFNSLRGYTHRLLRFWSYICVGSGLMMSVIPSIILLSGRLKRLGIQSEAMYNFILTYLSSFLWLFIIVGILAIVLGIVSAIVSERSRKKLFSPQ